MFTRIDCFFKSIYRTIKNFAKTGNNMIVLGHSFTQIEHHENVTVDVYECTECGKIELIWEGSEKCLVDYED